MAHFVEQLATQQLWHWLEEERGWKVDSEVNTGAGRIDLAGETPDGRYVGIELKADSGLSFGSRLSEQLWRYVDSEMFDEVYFASRSVDEVAERLESEQVSPLISVVSQATEQLRAGVKEGRFTTDEVIERIEKEIGEDILEYQLSGGRETVREYIHHKLDNNSTPSSEVVSLDIGIRNLSRCRIPPKIGVIEVPIPLEGGYLRGPKMALTPGEIHSPSIVRKAGSLKATTEPSFSWGEEPWVRHAVWQEFGGLPEGSIPNVMESEHHERPVDLIAFESSWNPTEILQTGDGDIIAVEAKGQSSFSASRIQTQLTEFIETKSISKLYLAVPDNLKEKARDLITTNDELNSVGLLTVDSTGTVRTIRDPSTLPLEYDGFKHGKEVYKTGYGDIQIPSEDEAISPFDLSEWRDPLKDDSGEFVVWDFDPRKRDIVIKNSTELPDCARDVPDFTSSLKSQAENASTARAYLLTGYSAAPYVQTRGKEKDEPKYGYVRMSIRDFQTEQGEYAVEFHFGAGGWEGGYICFVAKQVDVLVVLLSSLENVSSAEIPGQGQVIDLTEFEWEHGQNYQFKLGHEESTEKSLDLVVESTETEDGLGATLRLGEALGEGVEVTMTETQRIDLLRSLRIMRYGRVSELPGDGSGYQRVGLDGEDTWDEGTEIEKQHKPDELDTPAPTDSVEEHSHRQNPTHRDLLRRLQNMNPNEFEHFVADVWEHLGWNTNVVGNPGDKGIDVIARQGDEKQLIQAKRYGPQTTVGSPEVQQYASLRIQEDGVNNVMIVTTGEFSRQAEEMAPELEVLLMDGDDLLSVLDEIDGWQVVTQHLENVSLATGSKDAPNRDNNDNEGLLTRVRSWF